MPEEPIETQELKERLEEAHEHAAHGGAATPWLTWLSLSTAIFAVLAAVAALESGSFANRAIVQKNGAVLHQSKADDAWTHYHAKGVEATVYATQADLAPRPDLAASWRAEAERRRGERAEVRRQAEDEGRLVSHLDEGAEQSLELHHEFAKSVTVFQVAIALSAIAALSRRRPMWWVSLAVGAAGAAFFAAGLVH